MTQLALGRAELAPGVSLFVVEARPSAPPPPDVIVVVDLSGSLAGPPRDNALLCARSLLESMKDSRHATVVLAGNTARLVAPLGPLGEIREVLGAALADPGPYGRETVARACELARFEFLRTGRPAIFVLVTDLAFGPSSDVPAALARLEAQGAVVAVVEATSAFTPASPVRAPHVRIPVASEGEPGAKLAARSLAELLRVDAELPGPGTLTIELAATPLAWFSGEPLEPCAQGAQRRARIALDRGFARLAFSTRGGDRLGEARLEVDGRTEDLLITAQEAVLVERGVLGVEAR